MVKFTPLLTSAVVLLVGNGFVDALDNYVARQMKSDLRDARIVPDGKSQRHALLIIDTNDFKVLPEFEPTSFLKVTYHQDKMVQAGEELRPDEVVEMPHIWFPAPNKDKHYTIAMV